MPIIPRALLNCVVYLYESRADADAGKDAGGTGFLAAMPTDDQLGHHYVISNWHVAVSGGCSCFRVNTVDGFETFEYGPEDWIFTPGGDDIAVLPVELRGDVHKRLFVSTGIFVKEHEIDREQIGPGDDVFMIGRFVDIEQTTTNVPAVRFGNISTPPVAVKQETDYEKGECFVIDMHSRTGYSGSPCFFYRTPGNTLEWMMTGGPVSLGPARCALLGIHIGQFPEAMAIKRRRMKKHQSESLSDKSFEEYVEGMSGMTCVVPAWRIQHLLENHPDLIAKRAAVEVMREKNRSLHSS